VNRSTRLVAGTLVLALPLFAAVGCGAQKKKTVRQEFTAAQGYLGDSKAAAFTLRLGDAKGNLAKLITKDGDVPPAVVTALLKGSITYVTDPAGDATLKSVQSTNPADLKAAFSKTNLAFVIRDDKAEVLELRLIAGDLYAHVNLTEIGALAKAGGVDDFDASLDEAAASMDPRLKQALTDVRAGKWLKVPLAKYIDKLQDLAGSMAPGMPSGSGKQYDFSSLGKKAYDAVKPFVSVTSANDSSTDRVLDVKVQARPAIKALLGVLAAEKDLPFGSMLGNVDTEVDKNIKDGVAKGTITLHDSHLTQVAVDLESIRQLATDPGTDSFAGVQVVVEIDDSADQLAAPTDVSSFDLAAMLEDLVGSFFGGMSGSSQSSQMSYSFSG